MSTRLTVAVRACMLGLGLLLALTAAQAQFAEAIKQVRDAVVTVSAGDREGAGFVVNPAGNVLTNNHVVAGAKTAEVKLRNGDVLSATVLQSNKDRDLCVLKVTREHLPAVQFASSTKLKQGDDVAAVGAPLGLENTVTKGIISSTSREINGKQFLQIDAALNPGNSGGPVINADGCVVGVATKVAKEAQNVGFAVPSDEVMAFLDQAKVAYQQALGEATKTESGAKPEASPPAATPEAPPPVVAAPAEPSAPYAPVPWWMLLVGAAFIALVVALVTASAVAGKVARQAALQPPAQPIVYNAPYTPGPVAAPRPVQAPPPAAAPARDDLSDIDIELK